MTINPRFISGYRGESEYEYNRRRYAVRYCGHDDGHYNGDYYARGIRPAIGTIMADTGGNYHEFPPAELAAHFPGFVRARWNADFTQIEYDGAAPEIVTGPMGEYARFYAEQHCAQFPRDRRIYGLGPNPSIKPTTANILAMAERNRYKHANGWPARHQQYRNDLTKKLRGLPSYDRRAFYLAELCSA